MPWKKCFNEISGIGSFLFDLLDAIIARVYLDRRSVMLKCAENLTLFDKWFKKDPLLCGKIQAIP